MTIKEAIAALVVIICLLILSYINNAKADELTIMCCSYHVDRDAGYNETNYGLLYRGDTIIIGGYRNSEDSNSFVLGRKYEWKFDGGYKFRFNAGIVTGYKRSAILPLVLPEIVVHDNYSFFVLPHSQYGVIAFAYNITF